MHSRSATERVSFWSRKQNFAGTGVSYDFFVTVSGVYLVVSHFRMTKGQKKWEPAMQNKCPGFQVGFTQYAFCMGAGLL